MKPEDCAACDDADKEIAKLSAEVARLKALIERDKTGLALGLNKIQRIAKSFDWICEGRGPYEYDDDRYRMEVGSLIVQVLAVAEEHLHASGELANEAFRPRAKETARMLIQAGDEVCPTCEDVCHHGIPARATPVSRSAQKRIAIQRGEPMPTFTAGRKETK